MFALATVMIMYSCDKDEARGTATMSVRLHDLPIEADSVKVEILDVLIHTDEDGWVGLNNTEGIYDLLLLQNGVDTLIVPQQEVPESHVTQIRFILGDDNTIVVDGVSHELELSSQDESGLKLNVHQDLEDGADYTLVVDFDVNQSVILNGNGTYKLKPVLTAEFQ